MANKPLPTIGVDKYTIFVIDSVGDDGVPVYSTALRLPGTVEVAPTDTGSSDVFDADNGAYVTESYLEKVGHDLTTADIPPDIDALLRGAEYTGGVLDVKSTAAPEFGCGWRLLKSDGSYRYVKYYRGTYSLASSVGGKTKPSSGASEKQTAAAVFTSAASSGNYYKYADDTDLSSTEKQDLMNEFLGEALMLGFDSITVGDSAQMTYSAGAYKWSGVTFINLNKAIASGTSSGIAKISFDMLLCKENGKKTEIKAYDAEDGVFLDWSLNEYGSTDGATYVTIGYSGETGTYSSTDAATVKQGTFLFTENTILTHFVLYIDFKNQLCQLEITNDKDSTKGTLAGVISDKGFSTLEIVSNHTVASRMNTLKNYKFEMLEDGAVTITPTETASADSTASA